LEIETKISVSRQKVEEIAEFNDLDVNDFAEALRNLGIRIKY